MLMISSIIQALFKIKIQSSMSEQEKKQQRIYDLLKNKLNSFCLHYTKQRKIFFTVKELFLENGEWKFEQKMKRMLLTCLVAAIKKGPTMSISKHANKLKVQEKTVKTAIKQELSPDLNPLLCYMGKFRKQNKMQLTQILVWFWFVFFCLMAYQPL